MCTYRHCATCLITIELSKAYLCTKCQKRSYCSIACQKRDWNVGKDQLQGHKNWCNISCGEEDIDWEVVNYGYPKGFGIRAKRSFQICERIMIDCRRLVNDPVLNDMEPIHGTLSDKMRVNAIKDKNGEYIICVRLARTNHSCNPNAFYINDPTFNVTLLITQKEIQANDEIFISYRAWDYNCNMSQIIRDRTILQSQYNIFCEHNCLCYDNNIIKQYENAGELECLLNDMIDSCEDNSNLLQLIDDIEKIYLTIDIQNPLFWMRLYYNRFQVAIKSSKTIHLYHENINKAYDLLSNMIHPNSKQVLKWKEYINHPEKHKYYLKNK